jgi:cytochrome c1
MKLFLLNTIENMKSRKIGFTILGFFYNFLGFVYLWQKKKKERFATVLGQF